MTGRWLMRLFLGYPLDDDDLDELANAIPEAVGGEALPLPPWVWIGPGTADAWRQLDRRWQHALQQARERRAVAIETKSLATPSSTECPHPQCPLRSEAEAGSGVPKQDDAPIELIKVASPTTTPSKTFMDMAATLGGRLKKGVKRVIITDPFIHLDCNEHGEGSGHAALMSFLAAVGLNAADSFSLELTPAPKKHEGTFPLSEKPIGKKVLGAFPHATLGHHTQTAGGFHDRFYLVVDGSGKLHGLVGPSLNGLDAHAVVMLGDLLNEHQSLKTLSKLLLL